MGVRNLYEELGVDNYYINHTDDYYNPHLPSIIEHIKNANTNGLIGNRILDLCCGSGQVTHCLPNYKYIVGLDPYMHKRYALETGKPCYPFSFKDIQKGFLKEEFDTIICSFALHLCPKSQLPEVLWNLGLISPSLIIISPNKNPDCDGISGWTLVDEQIVNRVRMKIYFQ